MTALIYKASLPTYTSAEALAANAGESLLLNETGTAYDLEPAQSGASMRPDAWVGFPGGMNSITDVNLPIFLRPTGGSGVLGIAFMLPGMTMGISQVTLGETGPLVCPYAELFISNLAGTETFGIEADGGLTLEHDSATWVDISTFSVVGTDLASNGVGGIVSTAGGLFLVRLSLWKT